MLKVYLGARTTTDVSDSRGGTASPFDGRAVAKARSAATTSASRTKRRTRIPAIVALDALFRRFLQQRVALLPDLQRCSHQPSLVLQQILSPVKPLVGERAPRVPRIV